MSLNVRKEIAGLLTYPYEQMGMSPQVEHDAFMALSQAAHEENFKPQAWTINSIELEGRSSAPVVVDVLVSKALDEKLRHEWVPDGIYSVSRNEVFGELSRSHPALASVYQGRYQDVWVHAIGLPHTCQERLTAVSGIEESEVSLGGIARISVMGRSFAEEVVERQNRLIKFKDRYSGMGLPEFNTISHNVHPLDALRWDAAMDEVDLLKLGIESKVRGSIGTTESLVVDGSEQNFLDLIEAIGQKIVSSVPANKRANIDQSSLQKHLFSIVSNIRQIREVSTDSKSSPALLLPNDEIERIITLLDKEDETSVHPLAIDRQRRIWALLLVRRFMLLTSPAPLEGMSWVKLCKLSKI